MMKKTIRSKDNALYVDTKTLAEMLDCGLNTAEKIGRAAGARVKIGRFVRYSIDKVKVYLDSFTEVA